VQTNLSQNESLAGLNMTFGKSQWVQSKRSEIPTK